MTRDEKIAEAKRLRSEGLSYAKVGKILGVDLSTVRSWLNPKAAEKAREYYAVNRERILKQKQLPESKAKRRRRDELPETKARFREWKKEYNRKPEVKEKNSEYMRNRSLTLEGRCKNALSVSKHNAKKRGHEPCNADWETIAAFLECQDFRCYFCGVPEVECNQRLAMDHDHQTGEFRCWLCGTCNKCFGYSGLDPREAKALRDSKRGTA